MQEEIRNQGPERLGKELFEQFQGFYDKGYLVSPIEAGKTIAALAGEAGEKYRGQFIHIWDPEVHAFLQEQS